MQEDAPKRRESDRSIGIFVAALAILLSVRLFLSLNVSSSFASDDADQLIFSQTIASGYYEQAPLYSWLTWMFFQLLGLNRFSYYLLSTLVLGSVYVATFLCARCIITDFRNTVVAGFSPLLIPTFAWHSFSYLTNTNLVCAASAATFYALLRLRRFGRILDYILLGCTLGLGLLSKYNFVLVATVFAAAALSISSFRLRLLNYRIALTIGIAGLLILPNAIWVLEHWESLAPLPGRNLQLHPGGAASERIGAIVALLVTLLSIVAPLALVSVFFCRLDAPVQRIEDDHRLLPRFFVAGLVLLGALVVGGATHFHERWLQPFAVLIPLSLLSWSRLAGAVVVSRLAVVLIVIATVCAGIRGGQMFIGGFDRGIYPLQMNFSPVVRQLGGTIKPGSVVMSHDRVICGNLRYYFPAARHLCSSHPLYIPPVERFNGPRILIWNVIAGNAPPPDLSDFTNRVMHLQVPDDAKAEFVDLPSTLKGRRSNRLGYIVLTADEVDTFPLGGTLKSDN